MVSLLIALLLLLALGFWLIAQQEFSAQPRAISKEIGYEAVFAPEDE